MLIDHMDQHGVATITLDRPDTHNAFDDTLIAALTAKLRAYDADPRLRVLVMAANGPSFSAGADLAWMRRMADTPIADNLRDAAGLATLMRTLDQLSCPTIAVVQGPAYGGGVGLVACCDIVLAADRAKFCLSEVRLGLIPAVISPYVIAAIGPHQARRYFATAEIFTAEIARDIGLVHEIMPLDELTSRTAQIITHLLKGAPQAQRAAKRLIADVAGRPIDDQLIAYTQNLIADIRASDEGRAGVAAFLAKRPAPWIAS
jgi:methylglutaconyl-CoA hydratase